MIKKVLLNIFYVLMLSLIAILQVSLFSAWTGFFASLNLIILVLVFVLFFYNTKAALITAFIFAIWLELYSFNFFGIHFFSILISLYLINRISVSWLTNRSLYSFILLNVFAVFSYQFLNATFLYFSDFSGSSFLIFTPSFWQSTLYQIAWAAIISFFSFNFMIAFNDRYKPDFLGGKMKSR